MLHGLAMGIRHPAAAAQVVGVVPVVFAGVLLTVGEGGEVGKLCSGVRDGRVEHQHKAVGATHLAESVRIFY